MNREPTDMIMTLPVSFSTKGRARSRLLWEGEKQKPPPMTGIPGIIRDDAELTSRRMFHETTDEVFRDTAKAKSTNEERLI